MSFIFRKDKLMVVDLVFSTWGPMACQGHQQLDEEISICQCNNAKGELIPKNSQSIITFTQINHCAYLPVNCLHLKCSTYLMAVLIKNELDTTKKSFLLM